MRVYGNKLAGRGVARGRLYRFVRHPQYLCLGVTGWGLLTLWPRFLLLGTWVTMLFLYAGLARFEERRMAERFGDDYRHWAEGRGACLPGSPVRRLFSSARSARLDLILSGHGQPPWGVILHSGVRFSSRFFTRGFFALTARREAA